jgi:hypothetical protein
MLAARRFFLGGFEVFHERLRGDAVDQHGRSDGETDCRP